MAIMNAIDVANYFLTHQEKAANEERITHLKIQKLCYYAQGFALVELQRPLFPDPIVHWQHGPVVLSLWDRFKGYGYTPLPIPKTYMDYESLDCEVRILFERVNSQYGNVTAWLLRNMTHAEPPWSNTAWGEEISHQKMFSHFSVVVNARREITKKFSMDTAFKEMTDSGLDEVKAGKFSSLDEVRRQIASL